MWPPEVDNSMEHYYSVVRFKRGEQTFRVPTLLILNYEMDENSQVFAHQIEAVRKLAEKFEEIVVITSKKGSGLLPANVQVIESAWNPGAHFLNALRFLYTFIKVFFRIRKLTIFSHMTEVQSALIAPIAKLMGIRHVVWYAHKARSIAMDFNLLFVDKLLTSTSGSCPYTSSKVKAIGQGIDENKFRYNNHTLKSPINLVHIGRVDPSKQLEKLIHATINLRQMGHKVNFTIAGAPSSAIHDAYFSKLRNLVKDEERAGLVKFIGQIKREQIPSFLENFDVFIHAFPGSLDKALLEATFCGLPVATTNQEYLEIFGCWSGNLFDSIENELLSLFAYGNDERGVEIERRLKIAQEGHSLTRWIDQISDNLLKVNE